MSSKLVKLLEYARASKYDRQKMSTSNSFKSVMGRPDVKRLLLSEEAELTTMLQEEVLDRVVDGARQHAWIRSAVPMVSTDRHKARLVRRESPIYAPIVPEGGPYPVAQSKFDPIDVTIKNFGTRPIITSEMVEDSEYDMIKQELISAGGRIENGLNRYALSQMLDGCTSGDIDPTTFITASELVKSMKVVKDNNGFPDTVLMHQSAEAKLFDESHYSGFSAKGRGNTDLFGLTHYTITVSTSDSATAKWDGTDSANHYNAFVFDSERYARIVMRQDIKVTQYDDPIHDLVGMVVNMRCGVGITKSDAGVRILTK